MHTLLYARRGGNGEAEFHFRKDLQVSGSEGNGINFALFLSRSDDPQKLKEAEALLDKVCDARQPTRLLFHDSKLRYSVARARVCAKTGRPREASEYARVALALDGADGIDAHKRKPMDQPLLDEATRSEMQELARRG